MKQKNVQEGRALGVNAGIAQAYATKLRVMTRAFIRIILNRLTKLYKEHKNDIAVKPNVAKDSGVGEAIFDFLNKEQYYFSFYFSHSGKSYSKKMLDKVKNNSLYQFNSSLKSLFKDEKNISTSPIPKGMEDTIDKLVETNVALIRSIPNSCFNKIHQSVMSCLLEGAPVSKLRRDIMEIGRTEERKAELIAMDQTRKAYMQINIVRMKDAGVEKFKWLHTGGGLHPREYHRDVLNGKVFEIDKPPIIEPKSKVTGYPGQLPNCRCVMVPVVELHSEK